MDQMLRQTEFGTCCYIFQSGSKNWVSGARIYLSVIRSIMGVMASEFSGNEAYDGRGITKGWCVLPAL